MWPDCEHCDDRVLDRVEVGEIVTVCGSAAAFVGLVCSSDLDTR